MALMTSLEELRIQVSGYLLLQAAPPASLARSGSDSNLFVASLYDLGIFFLQRESAPEHSRRHKQHLLQTGEFRLFSEPKLRAFRGERQQSRKGKRTQTQESDQRVEAGGLR